MRELEIHRDAVQRNEESNQRDRALVSLQRMLIKTQELGDEKLRLVSQIIELIETRSRQLDQDVENLGKWTIMLNQRLCMSIMGLLSLSID